MVSLLQLSQHSILWKEASVFILSFSMLCSVHNNTESSAYRMVSELQAFVKSFMCTRNKNGPRTLPCGMPIVSKR